MQLALKRDKEWIIHTDIDRTVPDFLVQVHSRTGQDKLFRDVGRVETKQFNNCKVLDCTLEKFIWKY